MRAMFLLRVCALALMPCLAACTPGGPHGSGTSAQVEAYPSTPQLRVDAGSHVADIRGGGLSADGTLLLTASSDKTARLWSLPSGREIGELRPPVGSGFNGLLFSGALSPDGKKAAVAGWTPGGPGHLWLVYVFDVTSRRIVQELDTGAGVPINRLAFSPDGRYLAAGLDTSPKGHSQGIRVWRTADWSLAGHDENYEGSCFDLSFDRSGRLVTITNRNWIYLYDASFRLIARSNRGDGREVHVSIAFSPDGSRIAATVHEEPHLLSGANLAEIGGLDTTRAPVPWPHYFEQADALAWSADGHTLYAHSWFADQQSLLATSNFRSIIRAWPDGHGHGTDVVLPASPDPRSNSLIPQPRGGLVLFTGTDWSTIDSHGRPFIHAGAVSEALVGKRASSGLFLGANVDEIAFGASGQAQAFSVSERSTRTLAGVHGGYYVATTSRPGVTVDGLFTAQPRLNGRPLEVSMDRPDASAAAVGTSIVVVGAGFHLSVYGIDGTLRWRRPGEGELLHVNLSRDERIVVAAFGDGTIRWFTADHGRELLALFPHADGRRWVMWTPSGYYDASPGGEDLIGWHVNRGVTEAADFFPASRFHDQFYRPDIVSLVLQTSDEGRAIAEANAHRPSVVAAPDISRIQPPVVTIFSPSDDQASPGAPLDLRYSVRSPSGQAVSLVKVLFDGRPEDEARGRDSVALPGIGSTAEVQDTMRVTPPAGTREVALVAETESSASAPAVLRLRTGEAPAGAANKLYVLAVGVSSYAQPALKLGFSAKDAGDFSHVMAAHDRLYSGAEMRVLDDAHARRADVLAGLAWLKMAPGPGDVAMLFLSGHGAADASGAYYYLPQDADPTDLRGTAISNRDLIDAVSRIRGKVVLFLDTCHAGAALSARADGLVNQLISAENGAVVFASSTGEQVSLESPQWGNGAFTKELVVGLAGGADLFRHGNVSVADLNSWLSEKVPELTNHRQVPAFASPNTIPNFIIAQ